MTQPNQPDSVEEMAKKLRTRVFTAKNHQQMLEILIEGITQAKAEERERIATLELELERHFHDHRLLEEKYNELIMAVGNKYEGQTRHETALMYINKAQQGGGEAQALQDKK